MHFVEAMKQAVQTPPFEHRPAHDKEYVKVCTTPIPRRLRQEYEQTKQKQNAYYPHQNTRAIH